MKSFFENLIKILTLFVSFLAGRKSKQREIDAEQKEKNAEISKELINHKRGSGVDFWDDRMPK